MKVGLANAPRNVLYRAWILPVVPEDRYFEAVDLIEQYRHQISSEFPGVVNFIYYLRNYWGYIIEVLSVFNQPIRTNNISEGFNHTLIEKIGGVHKNIWVWIGKLYFQE